MPTPEAIVTQQCIDFARHKGFRRLRMHSGTLRTKHGGFVFLNESGTPDQLFLRPVEPGVTECFWCEFKAPGKLKTDDEIREILARPTKAKDQKNRRTMIDQLAMQEELRECGFLVLKTDNAETFQAFIETNFGDADANTR